MLVLTFVIPRPTLNDFDQLKYVLWFRKLVVRKFLHYRVAAAVLPSLEVTDGFWLLFPFPFSFPGPQGVFSGGGLSGRDCEPRGFPSLHQWHLAGWLSPRRCLEGSASGTAAQTGPHGHQEREWPAQGLLQAGASHGQWKGFAFQKNHVSGAWNW